ncbi:hypothetical protein Tco_1075984 [Tanacetum coccineum]
MIQMLRDFDKEDLETLWKLVKAKHGSTRPEEGYKRVLWGDLRTMFEHNIEYIGSTSSPTPRVTKKENEYVVIWSKRYKKCEECKYDKISYDKAYNDMQHQIERLQAPLEDIKGKSINTQCASNTLDSLAQKLDDENVSLEFQVCL